MTTFTRALILLTAAVFTAHINAEPPDRETTRTNNATKFSITISQETTRLTQPLTDDGRVDYLAAFDDLMRTGVSKENNAGVLIAQALGPDIVDEAQRTSFFDNLGIPVPPPSDTSFTSLGEFLKRRVDAEEADRLLKEWAPYMHGPWRRGDNAVLYAWIASNDVPLNLIQQASRRSTLYFPPTFSTETPEHVRRLVFTMSLAGFDRMRDIDTALTTRSMLHLGEGDNDAAREDLMTLHRLASLCERYPLWQTRMLSYGMNSWACHAEISISHYGNLNKQQAIALRQAIEQLPPLAESTSWVDIGERYQFLEMAQGAAHQGLDIVGDVLGKEIPAIQPWEANARKAGGIHYDQVLRLGNELFDRMVGAMRQRNPQREPMLPKQIQDELEAMKDYGKPERIRQAQREGRFQEHVSKMSISILLPLFKSSLPRVTEQEAIAHLNRSLATLAYALAAYHAEQSEFPQSLEELVPEYVPQLPLDPFSGTSLRYARNGRGYLLYSVGANGLDDQGATSDSQPPADDLVVRLD